MPNIDQAVKQWELDLSARVGAAVLARRKDKSVNMTATQLAERTKQLGYPISRVAITKIENNTRAGKVDVAELVVLAAALSVSPLQLLYPDLVDGPVEVFPNKEVTSSAAAAWFCGDNPLTDGSDAEDYFDGTAPLRLSHRVVKARRLLLDLIRNPQWEMGPGTAAFADSVNDLNNLKTEARRAGLVVEDSDG